MTKTLKISAYAMAILLLTVCVAKAKTKSTTVDSIAAIVNDGVITRREVDRAIVKAHGKKKKKIEDHERRQVLNNLIDDMLFDQLVAKASIVITDDELAKAIAGVLYQNKMTIEQLRKELYAKGMTYDEYKKDVEKQIKRIKFVNQVIGPQVKITDQDLRDYYQKHQEQFRGSHNAHIAQIIFPLANVATQAEFEKIRKDAMTVVSQARKGRSFKKLAEKYSKGPNVTSGGDLGMVDLKDLPQIVADTVRTMKIGDVSKPIFTGRALVIVKLISLPEISAADFDKMRDNIYGAMYDSRMDQTLNSYILKERQKAYIDIR